MTDSIQAAIQSKTRSPAMDQGTHHRAALGFILLSTDLAAERDLFHMAPEGVGVHFTRIQSAAETTSETLAAHADYLAAAASVLQPEVKPDVISYHCTSGSIIIGETVIFDEIRKGAPYTKPMCIGSAIVDALNAISARKIVVATPYLDEINRQEALFLKNKGFDVLDIQGLNLVTNREFGQVTPDYWYQLACKIDHKEAEAIFISCSGIRAVEVIEAIEQKTGKPVITSNQAQMWACLRLAGIEDTMDGFGKLLKIAANPCSSERC